MAGPCVARWADGPAWRELSGMLARRSSGLHAQAPLLGRAGGGMVGRVYLIRFLTECVGLSRCIVVETSGERASSRPPAATKMR